MTECMHGMNKDWCGVCTAPPPFRPSRTGTTNVGAGSETKQDVLNDLCGALGMPPQPIGEGSSVPSVVFDVMRAKLGLPGGSMPEVAEACARAAGLGWESKFDSRGTSSRGGSTVTKDGLRQVRRALGQLL